MDKIYVMGDVHTVSAFRLAGVEGVVCGLDDAVARLEAIVQKGDAAIVAVTNDLADHLADRIGKINLQMSVPVVVAIPGIDDVQGFGRSAMRYVSEALGVSL